MTGSAAGQILVVCIGNELVADDAVGFEVYQKLAAMDLPEGTRLLYLGVGGITLLDYLTGAEKAMIVVDAVQLGAPPGTIHCLYWDELPVNGNATISAHGIGLRETIEVGRLLYPEKIPPIVRLIGIEGICFNQPREAMTPATAAAIDTAVAACLQHITQYQTGTLP